MGEPDIEKLVVKEDVKGLAKALGDKRKKVREAAARALGRIADKRAVEPLMRALEDESEKVREAAVRALGNIGDKRTIKHLAKFLEYGDTEGMGNIKEAARVALLKIDEGKVSIKKGQCPICGTGYRAWEGRELRCNYCGVDLIVKQNQFLEATLEEVTDSPEYEVVIAHQEPMWDTRLMLYTSPPLLKPISLVWPTYCCICLKPVGRSNFHKMSQKTEYELEIPYCKDCHHKVRKFFGQREEEGVSIVTRRTDSEYRILMKFRNPQYARIFRQANKKQIRRLVRKPRL